MKEHGKPTGFKLRWKNDKGRTETRYVGWSGFTNTEKIEIDYQFARSLQLTTKDKDTNKELLLVNELEIVPVTPAIAQKVVVDPVSIDDWEILVFIFFSSF